MKMIARKDNLAMIIDYVNTRVKEAHNIFVIDTETEGLLWEHRPFSMQIGDEVSQFYFNCNPIAKDFAQAEVFSWEYLNTHFFKEIPQDIVWVGANLKFDMSMLAKEGISLGGYVVDVLERERFIYNQYTGYSLAECLKRRGLAEKDTSVEEYISKNELYKTVARDGREEKVPCYELVPKELIVPYGCRDIEVTMLLYLAQARDFAKLAEQDSAWEPQRTTTRRNEQRLLRACHEIEMEGVLVDESYTRQAMGYEQGLLDECRGLFREQTGAEFLDSAESIATYIPESSVPKTAKGNPSYDKKVLASLADTFPVAKMILDIRHHETQIKNFYSALLFYRDSLGYIHPNMHLSGTYTGRFSYNSPNLQNLPKDEDWQGKPFLVRKCLRPTPGKFFVSLDYDQQEFRLMLDYAGERGLIKRINEEGVDVHQATAELMGVTRKQAKTLNFGLLYGMGIAKLAMALGITDHEAKKLKREYFNALPMVEALSKKIINIGRTRGYVVGWAGRRFYAGDPQFAYRLPNHIIQGGGGDIMRRAIPKVHAYLQEKEAGRIAITIHDELLLEMDELNMGHLKEIKIIMESIYEPKNNMKLTVGAAVSDASFGQCDLKELEIK